MLSVSERLLHGGCGHSSCVQTGRCLDGHVLQPVLRSHALSARPRLQSRSTCVSQQQQQVTEAQRDYFCGPDRRPIILFDGVCNICNGGVNLALDSQSAKQAFRFAPLQSGAGRALLQRCGRQSDDISSIVLVEEDRCYVKSEAILRIGRQLDGPLSLMSAAGTILPRSLRDVVYDQVANNRYTLAGKREECRSCDQRLRKADFVSE